MSLRSQYRTFSQRKPKSARLLFIALILVCLLALFRLSLPSIIKTGAVSWLESQGLVASIDNIELSITDASFSIHEMTGRNEAGKGFALGQLSLRWQWKPLFDHLAIIDQFAIENLSIDAALFDNGDKDIAGIAIRSDQEATPQVTETQTEAEDSIPWQATIRSIDLSDIKLCLQQFSDKEKTKLDYCAKVNKLNWSGDISYKPSPQDITPDSPPLYVQGSLRIDDINLHNNQLDLVLLKLSGVDINGIDISTPDNITIDNIVLSSLTLMERNEKATLDDGQIFAFDKLDLQNLTLTQLNKLKLNTIHLDGTRSYLSLTKDGQTEIQQWIPEQKTQTSAASEDIAEISKKPFVYAFDEFIFNTQHHQIFIDNSLKEPFAADIHQIDIKLSPLDSNTPEQLSHLSLAFTIAKHGRFNLDADINPLSKNPDLTGKASIEGFDLKMFAPLSKKHIGHNIRSGQLDTKMTLNIDKGVIDSNIALDLHQFELKMLDQKEAEKINNEFGFPLNSSLSLLRDRDNTIRLEIPVTGNIENPEFDPRDAIIKATSTAITTAVVSYYTPFGLVFAAEALFDLATALNFDPVLFDAGAHTLNATHKEQLDKLANLLAERPGIHLTLCGTSSKLDKDKLFPASLQPETTPQDINNEDDIDDEGDITENVKLETKTPITLSDKNIETLRELAGQRSANIKNYLVTDKDIAASRLIECSPEYSLEEISGVEISI